MTMTDERIPITMIDYGASNIRSAQKAFEAVGAEVTVTSDPDVVRQGTRLVLPGVGAFGAGMAVAGQRRVGHYEHWPSLPVVDIDAFLHDAQPKAERWPSH